MIHLSVFLLSLSSIAFEILLTRIFSISQWNHLSFMVISMALFGFAASGVVIQVLQRTDIPQKCSIQRLSSHQALSICIILYVVSVIASVLTLSRIPIDYFRLTLEPLQIGYLLLSYLLSALPFFFSGFVFSVAYASIPHRSGLVYFTSMAGSALGAVVPALLLSSWEEGRMVVLAGAAPLLAVFFPLFKKGRNRFSGNRMRYRGFSLPLALGLCLLGIAVFLITPGGRALVSIQPSPYKALRQTLQFPDARVVESLTGLYGRIDHVQSRLIRFAPGLSLKFSGLLPAQSALFRDGDTPLTLYHLHSPEDADFAKYTITYAGYALSPAEEKVLIIQNGGGLGILCAIASGRKDIRVVEQNPGIADRVGRHYRLPVINQNPRAFLAQTQQRFGMIHIENWGSSLPGSAALNQDHALTIEAITAYLQHLTENGRVVIARKLLLPPADVLRLWAAAYESLRSIGAENPENHLAVLRNWDTAVLIISASPLIDSTPIERFSLHKNFDLVYIPGIQKEMTNRFNVFEHPYHYTEIMLMAEAYRSGDEKAFFASYPLDIAPQTDGRPFQSSFLKWTRLREFYQSTGSRFDALFTSGEMAAAAVFIEALVITLALLMIPRMLASKQKSTPEFKQTLYFLSIGVGFMSAEIYFIKKFVAILGDPVVSLTMVLAGILIFSAIGGYVSRNMDHQKLKSALAALLLTLVGLLLSLNRLTHWMLSLPDFERFLLAFLLLLPPGFLMGLPFPVGMRLLPKTAYERAGAWAVNGCASVLAAIAAVQTALGLGLPAVLACGLLAYTGTFIITILGFKGSGGQGFNPNQVRE